MAGGEAVRGPGHVGAPARHHRDAQGLRGLLEQPLAAAGSGRRLEEAAAGQDLRVVVPAVDADELLHLVVVGRHVGIGDGPRNLPAVPLGALEVHLRVTQRDAAPDVGLAADTPDPAQLEGPVRGREVRLLLRVEEELGRTLPPEAPLALFPGGDVGPELRAVEAVARVEHEHVDTLSGEVPGGHAAGGAAADDYDGVDLGRLEDLHPLRGCPA